MPAQSCRSALFISLVALAVVALLGCRDRQDKPAPWAADAAKQAAGEAVKKGDDPPRKPGDRKPVDSKPVDGKADTDGGPAHGGKSLAAWLAQLRDGTDKNRALAAKALGEMLPLSRLRDGGAAAGAEFVEADIKRVAAALGDALVREKSWEARAAALNCLRGAGTFASEPLLAALKSGKNETRQMVISEFTHGHARSFARKAVPLLIVCLKADDEGLRSSAAHALAAIDEAGYSLPDVIEASKADDAGGKAAIEALGRMKKAPRSAAPALLRYLKDPEPRVRLKAAAVLCELEENDKECLEALVELARRRASPIRREAAQLLVRYGSAAKAAVPSLVEAVRNDSDPATRQAAVAALGAIGPEAKAALPALRVVEKDCAERLDAYKAAFKGKGSGPGEVQVLLAVTRAAIKKIDE